MLILLLFIAGNEVNSRMARKQVDRLISTYPEAGVRVKTIDVWEDPENVRKHRVIMTPMLIAETSHDTVRLYGNLTDWAKLTTALGLPKK